MRAMVGPGQRSCYVELRKPTGSPDGYGQPPTTYQFVTNIWADIRGVTKMEYTASRQAEAAIDATIIIPYGTVLEADWIIFYQGEIYDIQSQSGVGYREGIRLLCRVRQR